MLEINREEAERFLRLLDLAFDEGLNEPGDEKQIEKIIETYPGLKSETVVSRGVTC